MINSTNASHRSILGASKFELDTPALLIDLDILESNISKIATFCESRGTSWRPHSKANKSPDIARLQLNAGAIGITCAKLSEAEMMVRNGITDVLLANQLGNPNKQKRLAEIQKLGRVIGIVDTSVILRSLSEAAIDAGTTVPLLIDIDIGMNRTGCFLGDEVIRIAESISNYPSLQLEGIMGYEGHVLEISPHAAKEDACTKALAGLIESRNALTNRGFRCDIVSAGGTGCYAITAATEGITEIQAGGGIFMDAFYRNMCHIDELEYALTILSTVSSRTKNHIVLDAGFKSLSHTDTYPKPMNRDDLQLSYLSAEHGVFDICKNCEGPNIGEYIELLPWYSDSTTFLHDHFICLRGGVVECVWDIKGRGMLT